MELDVRSINIYFTENIRNSITSDPKYLEIHQKLKHINILDYGENSKHLVIHSKRLYIPNLHDLKQLIFDKYHNKPYAGHPRD